MKKIQILISNTVNIIKIQNKKNECYIYINNTLSKCVKKMDINVQILVQ